MPSPALDFSRYSIDVMNEGMRALVFVIKRNHGITDIFSLFGWGWPVCQQYLLNLYEAESTVVCFYIF